MSKVQKSPIKASVTSYCVGFALSIALTLIAFMLVQQHIGPGNAQVSHQAATVAIVGLAIVQLVVQLVFFLHLGQEKRPRWNLVMFAFMLIVLMIVVFGSIWIMENLNYNMMMSPDEAKEYMLDHQGF